MHDPISESPAAEARQDSALVHDRAVGTPRRWLDGPVAMLIGIVGAEVAAGVSVGLFRRPGLGLLFVGSGIAVALRWARERRKRSDIRVAAQIEEADRLRAAASYCDAWNLGCDAANSASRSELTNSALTVLARVALDEGRFETARGVIAQMRPIGQVDPSLRATIERADGRVRRAVEILEEARLGAGLGRSAARLLVELRAESDELEWAVYVAIQCLDVIGHDDIRAMIASLESWGELLHASVLNEALAQRAKGALSITNATPAEAHGPASLRPTGTGARP